MWKKGVILVDMYNNVDVVFRIVSLVSALKMEVV
jgi:hypothetical protein